MALFVRQDENRSELQQRLATELQDRARKKAEEAELPDGITDSQYIKGTKESSSLLWAWILIGVLVVAVAIFLIIKTRG
jgi:F0F1-type ATP synthase assembly protein I